ncbi:MAG: peptidylprolyl isomerase [Cyclobacteriaceae bacterium]|jgi:peptidyl-prolyl cis-trans isomerase SurA|nr:peptidylprolyl isomerase [Flammeovirgaceae bacterium]
MALSAIAQEKEKTGFVVDKIIAKVDNYIVIKSELESAYQAYLAEGNANSDEGRCQLFNRLIMNKLMVAKAEIDSVIVTDLEVDQNTTQRMNAILQNSGNSPEELERRYGKSLEQIRVELRDQIREQLLAREMTGRITKDIKITPAEVKRFFNKIPKDSLPFYSSDVEIGQIVKNVKISNSQKEEAKRKLSEIRDRILNGEDFNTLAQKYSEDPSVKANGGEMGFVGRGQMVPQFEAMAFKLRKNEISQPFETAFGIHIMQLIDRRGNEYNSRHILLQGIPSSDDVKRAEKYLDSLRSRILNDSIKFEYAAKEYSDDMGTKGHGGYFTDPDGGIHVSLREIDPVVYLALDTMKVGQISKPLTYRSEDGKDAVRVLYFKAKIPPHQANLKDDWHRIQSAALAEKKDKVIGKWFNKSRQDVFINIDPSYNYCKILE